MMERVLNCESGAARDIVLLNAAATLYTGGITDSLEAGVDLARTTLDSGKAKTKQAEFVALTQKLGQ